jgi:two-component system phosphate regulon sensor histidine kinase PhoR
MNRTKIVIAASSLALLALIAFQVKWMTDSRHLIEEQFNQKVTMAMCYAVDLLGEEQFVATCKANSETCVTPALDNTFQVSTKNGTDTDAIVRALDIAMDRFKIHIDYDISLANPPTDQLQKGIAGYSCMLNPLEEDKSELLVVSFPGKSAYVFSKMKFMIIASILILTLITLVFLLANFTLLRQKRMQKMNKAFFNNMAHEFRTPLANISLANNLLGKNTDPGKKARYTAVVKEETKKLANQVDRILQLSKLENGEYQLNKEAICLKQLLQSVIEDMDLQIKAKQAKVLLSVDKELATIEGDKFHLSNAFRNLLENALKYSADQPEIEVRVLQEEKGIAIQFEDNGIGIAKRDQKEVFEQYYRVDHGNIHDQKGFGLGLAYVKMILDRHRGAIKIFSELHKGTRFDLFLPAK